MNIHGMLSRKSWDELSKLTENGGWLLFAWLKREMEEAVGYVPPPLQNDSGEVDRTWEEVDPEGYELAVATVAYLESIGLFEDNIIESKLRESINPESLDSILQ